MKIQIGSKFRVGQEPIIALAIPGAGILEVIDRTNEYPFDHIELKRHHLVNLKKEIEKELEKDGQETQEDQKT